VAVLLFRKSEPVLYAFDLLWLNGEDLRKLPLLKRKRRLSALLRSSKCERILYAHHIQVKGKRFFEEIFARDLEGIVAKRKLGAYKDDGKRKAEDQKPSYSQTEGRHELLTGGREKEWYGKDETALL
jgi:bifunctional non-homologous end joining protein LigD